MIMVTYNNTQTNLEKNVFYNLVEVSKPLIARKYYYMGTFWLLCGLGITLCVVIYQKGKLKEKREELNIEMQDIRNVAHMQFDTE